MPYDSGDTIKGNNMTCPHCGSDKFIKKGSDRQGKQRVKCANCGKGYSMDVIVGDPIDPDPLHYSLAPEFCPNAKRASSPKFTDNIDLVTCRTCRSRYNRQINPNTLTRNKSFSLTGEAIEMLELASNDQNKSQSAIVNDLIIENLPSF